MFNSIINYPPFVPAVNGNLATTLTTIDVGGEQMFTWGTPVSESWTSGTKDITGIEIVYNSITFNTASTFSITLQKPSSSANPHRPDNIPLALWSGSVTSSTFFPVNQIVTHLFTSSYTVSPNTKLGLVFKYDEFSSPTVVQPRSFVTKGEFNPIYGVSTSTTTGSTWSVSSGILPIRFVCTDGSRLIFDGIPNAFVTSLTTSNDYTSTATGTGIDSGDERGMLWIPKKTYDVTKVEILTRLTQTTSVANLSMYRDTTLLAQKTYTSESNPSLSIIYKYAIHMSSPIRVYPNDNIRFTVAPQVGAVRHIRFTFDNVESFKGFLGGDSDETEFSFTNRVNTGAWNTPPSASFSILPLQVYGNEVTGSQLLSGSSRISGSVTINGQPVSGAVVLAVRESDGILITTASSTDGTYQFNVSASNYHVFVEYQSGSQPYNAYSLWNVQPV